MLNKHSKIPKLYQQRQLFPLWESFALKSENICYVLFLFHIENKNLFRLLKTLVFTFYFSFFFFFIKPLIQVLCYFSVFVIKEMEKDTK